ncbi:MAG: PIN domain-containing protein [Terrimicrobiaceae bacterium]
MKDRYFVDTNILVYARDAGAGSKQNQADALIRKLWDSREGRLSVQVLNEYFVTVTRKLTPGMTPEAAWRDVETFRAWEPLALDWMLIATAHKIFGRFSLSWWDALIVAAAEAGGCHTLYSEDLQAGATYGEVRVVNPFA